MPEFIEKEPVFAYTNPFTGEGLNELPLRPICISIDNQAGARMQSGLNQADLVYEIPAEGGISRYLAVFYSKDAPKIGPVRSARPYLIDLARGWQGVFIHCGGSPDAYTYLKKGLVASIDEISNSQGFWRDKSRRAPHNLYTSTANLWEQIQKKGYDTQKGILGFQFAAENTVVTGDLALTVKLPYSGGKITFTYDAAAGNYVRSVGKETYIDRESKEPITAENIIIQQVRSKVLDSAGRLEINLVGGGKAWLIRDGIVQEGVWVRESLEGPAKYGFDNGDEFTLKQGKTWVEIVDQNVNFEILAESATQ